MIARIADAVAALGDAGMLQGAGRWAAKLRATDAEGAKDLAWRMRGHLMPAPGMSYRGNRFGQAAGLVLADAIGASESTVDAALAAVDKLVAAEMADPEDPCVAAAFALADSIVTEGYRPRGVGRPALPDARRVPCQTRLSEAEHAAATAAAQAAGLTLSEWVRGVVVAASRG